MTLDPTPDPPAAPPPVMPPRATSRFVSSFLRVAVTVLVLATAAWVIPTPYILRAPGHADDLSDMVHVKGGHPHPPGQLLMTTVVYEKANVLYCLYALLDPSAQLLPHEGAAMIPRPRAPHPLPVEFQGPDQMTTSKLVASVVALRHLGHPVQIEGAGVRVAGFLQGSPAQERLQLGDVIEVARGQRVRSARDLRRVLRDLAAGTVVPLKILRAGKRTDGSVPILRRNGRGIIGIVPEDVLEPVALPIPIRIDTRNVNGASAGLMFTLEIIDQLTPGGITSGQRVAGTGTIESNGNVGPIEGAELKQVAAERAGATVFLVPRENFQETLKHTGMQVVPVSNLDDALKALRKFRR